MWRDETSRRECDESATVRCRAVLVKMGNRALISTGTTPACARAQTEHECSGVREASG